MSRFHASSSLIGQPKQREHLPNPASHSRLSLTAGSQSETQTFVPTDHYEGWSATMKSHLDWSRKPSEVALTIYGDAGVGKTRSVFQILDGQINQRELVLYTNHEQAAIEIATALANDGSQTAMLVADECLSRARFRLSDLLRRNEHR